MPKTRASSAAGSIVSYYGKDLPAFYGNSTTEVAQVNNIVYFSPCQVPHACTVDGVIIVNGSIARTGSAYVALYDKNPANWQPLNRLAVSASVALSGITRRQLILFAAPVAIPSGLYFCAVIKSVTADNTYRASDNVEPLSPVGFAGTCYWSQALGAYLAPTNPAVPVQEVTIANTVWMWLHIQ